MSARSKLPNTTSSKQSNVGTFEVSCRRYAILVVRTLGYSVTLFLLSIVQKSNGVGRCNERPFELPTTSEWQSSAAAAAGGEALERERADGKIEQREPARIYLSV